MAAYVKSATHKAFGRGAWNWRFTRSSGQGTAWSLLVVRTALPRVTPYSPMRRIRRATVQRATSRPSRRNCRQTFRTPVDLEVFLPDPSDNHTQLGVASRAGRCLGRIGRPGGMGVVGRRGDRQHSADRLGPVDGAVRVDEGDHFRNGRSSSAWAKYADALRRISFAWRSSRTSRSSALIRSCSSVVGPGRLPWSRSACRTQPRNVSAVQPIFAAIELIAAHCEACSSA